MRLLEKWHLVLDKAVDSGSRCTKKTNETKVTKSTTSTLSRVTSNITTGEDDATQNEDNTGSSRNFRVFKTTNQQQCVVDGENLKSVLMSTLSTVEDILLGILLSFTLFSVNYIDRLIICIYACHKSSRFTRMWKRRDNQKLTIRIRNLGSSASATNLST